MSTDLLSLKVLTQFPLFSNIYLVVSRYYGACVNGLSL